MRDTAMGKDPEARKLRSSIVRNGYVEVDDHSLPVLGQAFRLDRKTGKLPRKDRKLRVQTLFETTSPDRYPPHPEPDFQFEYRSGDFPPR